MDIQLSQHYLLMGLEHALSPFSKVYRSKRSFLASQFPSQAYLSTPMRMPSSSEPSAMVSSKVKTHELSSILFFIFKTVIAILDPLHFRIQNLNQLFNFCKAVNRDCKKDCLESVDQSGEYVFLTILYLLIPEHAVSFPL